MRVGGSVLLRIIALILFVIAFIIEWGHATLTPGSLGFIALGLAFWVVATLVP